MFDKLTQKISDAFRFVSGKSSITEKNIDDAVEAIKMALLEADVNLRVVRRFVNATIEEAKGEKVLRSVDPGQQFIKIVHDKMVSFLGDARQDLVLKGPDTISAILMLGLQGSGKTTSSAKMALRLKKEGRKPLLIACDLVRPAAVEQLSVLAHQIDVPVYKEEGATDSVKVYKGALDWARKNLIDTLIIDTTGRLQIDEPMMQELSRLKEVSNPDELLLVADAMTGQSAVDIAKAFDEKIGLTGVVLTKFDSDTRGGAALSLKTITGKPLKFVGVGEKPEDFEPFHPDRIAGRILGMGDVVSLVEKAQEVIDQKDAQELQKKMEKETFTLEDWLDQLRSVKKMGSLNKMLEMIPGMAGQVSEEDIDKAELQTQEAILSSMTRKERANHLMIGPSRRARVARGSGTSVAEVSRLLKKFDKMKTMMKKMSKMSKNPNTAQAMMNRMQGGFR
ncbi:signal recognition particle protein [Leadbettera azotonutricia]|uniref:Signal recognition particle protein n=1 Tax=Leadbettera azotonutricia (strain ATCC BAA-888 / DSM 13862 / ZAS-9) TaxID=545695 RepID=F5Y8R7_LEAAZ|nr:signal recognition particle protein [Leadbettera azotonutricia]AEF82066.1 signal recognition particle protein [Leadbettera azotonutricia ZAS-9]